MVHPSIKIHQLYSVNFCADIDIIFEDLNLIDISSIKKNITNGSFNLINIIPNRFFVNTDSQLISLVGYKINEKTYFVSRDGNGSKYDLTYNCSNKDIITCVNYLYHMYNNLV